MLFHIVRKELLDQLLSLRFAIACVVCLVVFVLSSLVLARDYREANVWVQLTSGDNSSAIKIAKKIGINMDFAR